MQFLSSSAEGARNLGTKERKSSDREISQCRIEVWANRAMIRGNHVGTHTVRKQTNVFIRLFSLKVSGAPPGCSESTDVLAHTVYFTAGRPRSSQHWEGQMTRSKVEPQRAAAEGRGARGASSIPCTQKLILTHTHTFCWSHLEHCCNSWAFAPDGQRRQGMFLSACRGRLIWSKRLDTHTHTLSHSCDHLIRSPGGQHESTSKEQLNRSVPNMFPFILWRLEMKNQSPSDYSFSFKYTVDLMFDFMRCLRRKAQQCPTVLLTHCSLRKRYVP